MNWNLVPALDPLIAASLLLGLVGFSSLLPIRWPLWGQVSVRLLALLALTLLVQRTLGSPIAPRFGAVNPTRELWERLIEAGWWIFVARAAVAVGRLFVVLENRPRETRIVADLLAAAIYVFTALAIINFSFDVPIKGVLATSGVIAIVLGLALQSTLSDVFSGIAVGLERPYKPGDLLWVEGNIEGRVIQLDWRSTQIATGQDNIAIVPNSVIAKARLVNRSAPTLIRGDTVTLDLDPGVSPETCVGALVAATKGCNLLLSDPAASVACSAMKGDGARYEITFSVPSTDMLAAARTEIFQQAYRHLHHAGIALAVAGVAALPKMSAPTPQELLEQSDLFGVMEEPELKALAGHFEPVSLEPEAYLFRQGDAAYALFVVASGTAEITRRGDTGSQLLHRMGPGESLGAIGLITGEPYSVTVMALTPMKFLRLQKTDLTEAIKIMPELSAGLERLAQRGQAALQRFATAQEAAQITEPEVFLMRLRKFLHRLGG